MASSLETVKFIADQIEPAGNIVTKKLFGEYGLWCDGKFFGTVEHDQFYVKITESGGKLLPGAEPAAPHGGAPGMYLVPEVEDAEFLVKLVKETCRELPAPKEKKKRTPRRGAGDQYGL